MPRKMPKVSVVIPVYNVEMYLDRCVQSVLNQTLADIEIILVDDQSPDKCPFLCDEYARKDSRVKVVHKQNGGLGLARNSGLDVATGEYVAFLDSDDYVEPETYQVAYERAVKDDLDACYFKHCRFFANGTRLVHKYEEETFMSKDAVLGLMLNVVGSTPDEKKQNPYHVSSCMAVFKRSTIENNHIRFVSERQIASEDVIFDLNFFPCASRIVLLPDVFYNYFVNEQSISRNYDEKKLDRFMKLLVEIPKYLSRYFPKEVWMEHFFGHLIKVFKIILRYESQASFGYWKRRSHLRKILSNSILDDLLKWKNIWRYPAREKVYLFCMKTKFVPFFIFIYHFRNGIN